MKLKLKHNGDCVNLPSSNSRFVFELGDGDHHLYFQLTENSCIDFVGSLSDLQDVVDTLSVNLSCYLSYLRKVGKII